MKYFDHNMLTSVLAKLCPYYPQESKSCCSVLKLVDSFDTIVKLIEIFPNAHIDSCTLVLLREQSLQNYLLIVLQ